MRKTFLLTVLTSLVFAIDLRHPQNTQGGQQGANFGNQVKNQYNSKSSVRNKLQEPINQQNLQVIGPDGTAHNTPKLCAGSVGNERMFAQASISGRTFSFRYATDPYNGSLNQSLSFSARYLCPAGYCTYFNGTTFTDCYKYSINSSGYVQSQYVSSLNGCVDIDRQGQLPSYFAGPLISDLLNYYSSVNKPITNTRIVETQVGTTEYYGGQAEDCDGQRRNPPQTQYLNNPYTMNDHAIYYYLTCDPQDPTCKAVKGVMDSGATNTRSCTIELRLNTTGTRTDGRICTPGQKIFPDGYSEVSTGCFSGDKFFNYSSYFWLECNLDGKGYTLRGWGYWEGAPCGYAGLFPPSPQVIYSFTPQQSFDWTHIGNLSVNRRRGGEGLSSSDRISSWDAQCVSDEPTPYRTWVKNTYYPSSGYSVLEVRVDNAPSCNYFRWSRVMDLIGEEIVDNCQSLEREGCELVNEWWEDANGRRIQMIENGKPVQQASGCVEVLWSSSSRSWTSSTQTYQAPPQNCNFPPKTCMYFGSRQECRQWWRKIREYRCGSVQRQSVDLSEVPTLLSSTRWDTSSGVMDYRYYNSYSRYIGTAGDDPDCGTGQKYCVVKYSSGGKANYDVLACQGDYCPAGSGQVMEACKCGDRMVMGFGIATATMSVIYNALMDRTCR